jgi:hypothetical protein
VTKNKTEEKMVVEKLEEVLESITLSKKDAEKFDKGVAAAGTRLRKQAQTAIALLKDLRREVLDVRKERKGD